MKWIGLFNIGYGLLGLASAFYLGRLDAVLLCVWVILAGLLLRTSIPGRALGAVRRVLFRSSRGDVTL